MDTVSRVWGEIFCPTDIKFLKYLLIIENIFGVHRSIACCGKIVKTYIYFDVFINLALISLLVLKIMHYDGFADLLYNGTAVFDAAVIIFPSLYTSTKFKEIVMILNYNHNVYNDNKDYLNKLHKSTLITIAILVATIVIHATYFYYFVGLFNIYEAVTIFFCMFFWRIRYVLEFSIFFYLLQIFSEQQNCTVKLLNNVNEHLKDHIEKNNKHASQFVIYNIKQWSSAFLRITEGTKLFNSVFGFQFTSMMATYIVYVVNFIYYLIKNLMKDDLRWSSLHFYLVPLILILIDLPLCLSAAQSLQANGQALRQGLCRLLNNSLSNESVHKRTKEFHRLVSTRSVRIEATGFTVHMPFFSSCILLFTSYSIVILQFNNIV